MNIEKSSTKISRQFDIFHEKLMGIGLQRIGLAPRLYGKTHTGLKRRLPKLLPLSLIEVGLIPAGSLVFIREPFKGVEMVSQCVLERFGSGRGLAGGLVTDLDHYSL